MWMTQYIIEIKKQFRDVYGFVPSRTMGNEPCFDNIPDGEYPMTIEEKLDRVKITGGRISCCNFDTPCPAPDNLAPASTAKAATFTEGEMDKEQTYDAEISPLIAQIIAICKRAGISCLCTFDITTEKNDGCMCTTCLPDENGVFPEKIKEAEHVVYRKPEFFAFTITTVPASTAKEE